MLFFPNCSHIFWLNLLFPTFSLTDKISCGSPPSWNSLKYTSFIQFALLVLIYHWKVPYQALPRSKITNTVSYSCPCLSTTFISSKRILEKYWKYIVCYTTVLSCFIGLITCLEFLAYIASPYIVLTQSTKVHRPSFQNSRWVTMFNTFSVEGCPVWL